eukprot:CAMPEP_0185311702 /NCGR_PEP_ID=MMETSP1363-20130426/28133_1 /TAXON_ID=38817 /ORGANISM="Gephyrocapsa oceanica, Strain RCC1303" /LENGTH=37 /DNA_ID= /DNA_START= /DNA_END= /DNA_ORIENTATION=
MPDFKDAITAALTTQPQGRIRRGQEEPRNSSEQSAVP